MTAAPEGVDELDYEAEEAAILQAVGNTELDLLVDESGEAAALVRHLEAADRPPVLHISCHGDDAWPGPAGEPPRPVLMLEDADFRPAPADANALITALRPAMPRLVFLSACLSAAAPADASARPTAAQALASDLVKAGLPAALGWAGSVGDQAATHFAACLYQRLAHHDSLAMAVADARRALLDNPTPQLRAAWPMARLWVGPSCAADAPLARGTRKRSLLNPDHIHPEFLGKDVPVAAHQLFVGRRRELKQALAALDGNAHAGLILTGMGRLGKSSLAARIVNRRAQRYAVAVLHGRFGPQELLHSLADALQGQPAARALLEQGRRTLLDALQRGPEDALIVLAHLLTELLGGPCKQAACDGKDGRPLLLVLDDFEQLLDDHPGPRPVAAEHAGLLVTLLRAFDPTRSDSRLLVTSRFPFTLQAGGVELAARLQKIDLASFSPTAAAKLTLRQRSAAPAAQLPDFAARCALLPRAQAAARGNPGLQQLLCSQLLLNPAVPLASTATALDEMEAFLAGGQLPGDECLRSQLEAIAVDTLLGLAGEPGRELLRRLGVLAPLPLALAACTVNPGADAADTPADAAGAAPLPVPAAVAEALGGPGPLATLRALALVEPAPDPALPGQPALRPSPLAAGRVAPGPAALHGEVLRQAVARDALPALAAAWGAPAATPSGEARLLLCALALFAGDAASAASHGAPAVRAMAGHNYPAAARLADAALALIDGAGLAPPLPLLAAAADAIATSGDGSQADTLFARAVSRLPTPPAPLPADALPLLDAWATRLYRRGQLDEALRIREQEQLPVYRRLGDVRAIAVCQGRIADILHARGQLDEALRILQQDSLPAFQQLGDVSAVAITQGKIADILHARGQLDEALRIREQEQLPVYRRLGDVRAIAVTQGQIADILLARGQLDEALRIREQEELPVYRRLGDVREITVCQGKIADILQARGQLDAALRIREQEELPVYRRLGDVREIAVCQRKIADILEARGQLDEALRILQQDSLPAFQQLGSVLDVAVIRGRIADILHARGQLDEALRIREQEELPVYRRLGDVSAVAVTQGKIADILHARGQLDEALRIREQEQLPALQHLGDVRALLVARANLALNLLARAASGDRERAAEHLCLALADARRLRIPEAGQIEAILQHYGLRCDA